MKIALHVDGPVIRGNEHQVLMLAGGLVKRGHHVVASCRSGGPVEAALRARGVTTTGIRPRGDLDVVNALRFSRWLKRENVDAVLLTSWVRAFVGGWAAHMAGVPRVVFRIGGIQPIDAKHRARTERHALRSWVDVVIANSTMVFDHMTTALPDLRGRTWVVPNGVTPDAPPPPLPLRAELGVPDDALFAVAVGGMERNKGFDTLIEALPLTDNLHVALVGGGTPDQKGSLTSLAQVRGVSERVHFLGRRTDIPAVLASCDMFVLPSRSEGFSVALLEAMLAGIPVVSTDVGGPRDALSAVAGRPAAGWIAPCDDADALADRMNDVAYGIRSSDGRIAAAVAESTWRVRNWYTTEHMIDGYEAILAGMPASHPAVR